MHLLLALLRAIMKNRISSARGHISQGGSLQSSFKEHETCVMSAKCLLLNFFRTMLRQNIWLAMFNELKYGLLLSLLKNMHS